MLYFLVFVQVYDECTGLSRESASKFWTKLPETFTCSLFSLIDRWQHVFSYCLSSDECIPALTDKYYLSLFEGS